MTPGEVMNMIAIIVIPLVAVFLGRHLQDRAEKRNDKMEVFKSVMTFRYGWSPEGVKALNNIHIVFSEDNKVRDCWRKYYKELCVQKPNTKDLKRREDAMYDLLENMAKNLGYKDTITREDIRNPYVPQGMVDAINYNNMIQTGMASLIQQINTDNQQSQKHIELK